MPQMQNRVQETTTTGGTGTLTLAGAVTGYITFASGFSTSTSLFYTIDNGVGEWEIGIGTLVTTGTLSRVTVIASSNGGALVNFGSGTKRVFCSAPTRSLVPDQDSKSGYVLTTDGTNPAWTQTLNGITIGNLTAAGGAFTTLSASSTVSGTGFSTYLASPPAIGGTTPAAGNFTTLGATGNVTLGDAAGDTLTINGTAVSIPNNLNFDSNTLFIDAANNRVGMGTSSPGARLQIEQNQAAYTYCDLVNTTNGGGAIFRQVVRNIANTGTTSVDYAKLIGSGLTINNNDTNSLNYTAFGVGASERMRIDSSGKLGINVIPSAGTDAKLQVTGLTTNATNLATSYSAASVVLVPKSTSGYSLAIASGTGDSPQLQVSANGAATGDLSLQPYGGNVVIGTSTSSGKLTVSGVSSQNVASFLSSASGTFSAISIGRTANEFSLGTVASGNQFFNGTAVGDSIIAYGTGKLFIGGGNTGVPGNLGAVFDSSGNVGIGTSSPTQKLHVARSGSGIVARFTDAATQTLDIGIAASAGIYYDNPNGGYQQWSLAGSAKMTLDASGNLLLNGTSTPTSAQGCLVIYNRTSAPTASISGGILYVESGALKYRGSSGTVTTIANA